MSKEQVERLIIENQNEDGTFDMKGIATDVVALIYTNTQLAKIDTARKILHSGWCIPEMEVQVEDYINVLQKEQPHEG